MSEKDLASKIAPERPLQTRFTIKENAFVPGQPVGEGDRILIIPGGQEVVIVDLKHIQEKMREYYTANPTPVVDRPEPIDPFAKSRYLFKSISRAA